MINLLNENVNKEHFNYKAINNYEFIKKIETKDEIIFDLYKILKNIDLNEI